MSLLGVLALVAAAWLVVAVVVALVLGRAIRIADEREQQRRKHDVPTAVAAVDQWAAPGRARRTS